MLQEATSYSRRRGNVAVTWYSDVGGLGVCHSLSTYNNFMRNYLRCRHLARDRSTAHHALLTPTSLT